MSLSQKAKENKRKYISEYTKKNYKRIPLNVRFDEYDKIVKASSKTGESINGYIKKAIEQRLKKES